MVKTNKQNINKKLGNQNNNNQGKENTVKNAGQEGLSLSTTKKATARPSTLFVVCLFLNNYFMGAYEMIDCQRGYSSAKLTTITYTQ